VFFSAGSPQKAAANGETRTISFHHMHTNEDLTVTFKVNGRYDEEALAKINNVLRDWREAEPIKMDPQLIDLLWEVHRETGSKEPIWVVCGYRSPATNSMLRSRSSGVAKFSQHMLGKAVDFYIPGVPLDQLRAAGLRAQRGGVGFYPTSGSPFVHLDTGSVRHWPRMPEAQLATVLAKGQLASHSASDPRGTQIARGDISNSRKSIGFLAKLFGGGKDEEEDAETAAAPTPAKPAPRAVAAATAKPATTATASATDKAATEKVANVPMPAARPVKPATYQVASADSRPIAPPAGGFGLASTTSTPVLLASDMRPTAKPAIVAADDSAETKSENSKSENKQPRPAQGASLVTRSNGSANANMTANDVIKERGYWQGLPSTEPVEAPKEAPKAAAAPAPRTAAAPAAKRVNTVSADPATTATVAPWPIANRPENEPVPSALSYAAQPTPIAAARAVPMGHTAARPAPAPQAAETTVAAKRADDLAAAAAASKVKSTSLVRVGDRFNDPWMRAMIVSPSAQSHMRTTVYGVQDFRTLGPYLQKPATTVAITFSDDPNFGMSTSKFAGSAVAFTPTVTFHPGRTAALK
jgi:uncharacterized protein YcbK (DUF882 family)